MNLVLANFSLKDMIIARKKNFTIHCRIAFSKMMILIQNTRSLDIKSEIDELLIDLIQSKPFLMIKRLKNFEILS